MGNSHESLTNGKLDDSGLQIIKHPLFYQSYSKSLLSWLDIRVFYIRVSNFVVDGSTPGSLTLNHIPLSPDTLLEVNGARCSMHSEGASCVLRRDRVDKKSEEATFVSTDSIRLTGSVKFEVFDRDDLVLSGVLEISNSNGVIGESKNSVRKWKMNCEPVMSAGSGFLKGKHITGSDSPTIEVYVAGCFSGTPIILTKTLQLNHWKKQHRKGILGSIPEDGTTDAQKDVASSGLNLQVPDYTSYKPESEEDYNDAYWRHTEYLDGEDGELSWFNAGVRVGVGIGLGICVGVGIGVGLLVRSYHSTTRNFRRRFI
ncbi:uncharacterized protein At1g01500 [Ipomoea triloba]|uniref:uncharacterized protein At1g01500 n=1 Tax=Ipomoea triloba TaxID=35885 RepID=UPI00125E3CCB|nr:uncharacterized protein At1g01500 [Ipomoea triloba]XP_031124873.1 uncharacterized protein At1g01500 [Ipomoea triloba]XP_031124874.1 uncharacterized protein At1g01500 [Ipomoea triloba]